MIRPSVGGMGGWSGVRRVEEDSRHVRGNKRLIKWPHPTQDKIVSPDQVGRESDKQDMLFHVISLTSQK